LADVLFGDYNPAGRLPVTFYKSADQLPPFTNYAMAGRTYRYFTGEPLYPFGYGLSYTTFSYSGLTVPAVRTGEAVKVSVQVQNTGSRGGEEVVQLYLKSPASGPIRSLEGFQRIALRAGEKRTVQLTLLPRQFARLEAEGKRTAVPGDFTVWVGGGQPGPPGVLAASLHVTGAPQEVKL
jgi:beta-glucosidase